jgi:hypothetical protein
VLTMIYQPGVDLAAIRHGWYFIVAAATASALIAAGLAVWWKTTHDVRVPSATGGASDRPQRTRCADDHLIDR